MESPITRVPELLAPAGGPPALRAAVANGADAVYLGLDSMNARRSAENFTLETLPDVCRFAHLRDTKVYVTTNIALLAPEVPEALRVIARAWEAGADGFIVQDLGLLRALRLQMPQVRVHASTQINAHSSSTVRALCERGVRRVTLAREMTIDEIAAAAAVAAEFDAEVESFVHGALCMSYSGQCLLSSLIGGRSANRGLCAQPCRLAYELVDRQGRVLETPGAHLLSPKDIANITRLPELMATGVGSLKIEGRMKSPEYVAMVTKVYRAALDRAAASPEEFEVRDGEMSVLSEAFSRGFTDGYLTGEPGNSLMSYARPNNRGVPVGRITAVRDGEVTVDLDSALDSEDTIQVWTSRGRFAQPAGEMFFDGEMRRSVPGGARVRMSFQQAVGAGDRVFRVRNAALSAAAERTYMNAEESAPISIDVDVRIVQGRPLRITITDTSGRSAYADGPVVEAARTKAVTAEEVIEHVGRLGNTPYVVRDWSVDLTATAGIGFSVLHRVRREALGAFENAVLRPWVREPISEVRLEAVRPSPVRSRLPRLVVAVSDVESAAACLSAGADECHVPASEYEQALQADLHADIMARMTPVLSRICHDAEQDRCGLTSADRAVAGTLGALRDAVAEGKRVQAHWSLNVLNQWSAAELADMGASLVWLSPELAARQVADLARTSPVPLGMAVSGRQELMVTEHCILMAQGECAGNCASCGRRRRAGVLRDRKGFEFPIRTDEYGRSHVFNSVDLDLTHVLGDLLGLGLEALRIDAQIWTREDAVSETVRVRDALKSAVAGHEVFKRSDVPTTSGHYFRGVR